MSKKGDKVRALLSSEKIEEMRNSDSDKLKEKGNLLTKLINAFGDLYDCQPASAPSTPEKSKSLIAVTSIVMNWNEAGITDANGDDNDISFASWKDLNYAIEKACEDYESRNGSKSDAYNKVKLTIKWGEGVDGVTLVDRVDIGNNDYLTSKDGLLGLYLMKRLGVMYSSDFGERDKADFDFGQNDAAPKKPKKSKEAPAPSKGNPPKKTQIEKDRFKLAYVQIIKTDSDGNILKSASILQEDTWKNTNFMLRSMAASGYGGVILNFNFVDSEGITAEISDQLFIFRKNYDPAKETIGTRLKRAFEGQLWIEEYDLGPALEEKEQPPKPAPVEKKTQKSRKAKVKTIDIEISDDFMDNLFS